MKKKPASKSKLEVPPRFYLQTCVVSEGNRIAVAEIAERANTHEKTEFVRMLVEYFDPVSIQLILRFGDETSVFKEITRKVNL